MQHFTLSHPATARWKISFPIIRRMRSALQCRFVMASLRLRVLYSRWYIAARPLKGTAWQGLPSLNISVQCRLCRPASIGSIISYPRNHLHDRGLRRNIRSRTCYSESSLSFNTPSLPVVRGESTQRSFRCSCRKCSARCRCRGRQDPFAGVFMAFV